MTSKERIQNTLDGKTVDRVPVFPLLMAFSASRIGACYRQYAQSGGVLAEAQLAAAESFNIDVVTACSDAFRLSADLGGDMMFPEDKPPYIREPLVKCSADLKRLKRVDVTKGRSADRMAGVRQMVKNSKGTCVAGWVDMPFAEACSLCGVSNFMLMLYDEPKLAHAVLEFLTANVIDFALSQTEESCDMIGCGDAAASLLSREFYSEFALPYEKRVIDALHGEHCPVKLHICGNTGQKLDLMASSGADLFNVDHPVSLSRAGEIYGKEYKTFKGNLNPAVMLRSSPSQIAAEAADRLEEARGKKFMLSAGCEIPAEISDEQFSAFCNAVL